MIGEPQLEMAEHYKLVAGHPGLGHAVPIAVMLFDRPGDRIFMRFRPDLAQVVEKSELDYISLVEEHFHQLIRDDGARAVMDWMTDTLSNYLRLEGPEPIDAPADWKAALDAAYARSFGHTRAVEGHA